MAGPVDTEKVKASVVPPPPETQGFFFHHICHRVRDPCVTLKFYSEMLGMRLLDTLQLPKLKTTMYFMAYCDEVPEEEDQKLSFVFGHRAGVMEFMHHWGSENIPDLKYCDGNQAAGKGYSHICLRVPDIQAACARLEKHGVKFIKRHDEGTIRCYCYFLDPDGYWVELLASKPVLVPDAEEAEIQVKAFTP